jgi:hypothetical protein
VAAPEVDEPAKLTFFSVDLFPRPADGSSCDRSGFACSKLREGQEQVLWHNQVGDKSKEGRLEGSGGDLCCDWAHLHAAEHAVFAKREPSAMEGPVEAASETRMPVDLASGVSPITSCPLPDGGPGVCRGGCVRQ